MYLPVHVPISPLDTPIIPNTLSGIRAMTSLNLASSSLGELVLPAGWTKDWMYEKYKGNGYKHTDGREQKDPPEGSKAEGVIAIANAIPDMGAMTSLNLASNELGVEGAKIIAACLPKCT